MIGWTLALLRLNYWRIYDNTFWVDETWSIRLARMSLSDMIKKTATDMHPPLFYMLAMAMNRLFGDNGPAYHLSALLPYVGILFLACTEVRRELGLGPAFLLVTMMSLMPEPLYYNVEVRMYSLGAFLVLTAFLALRGILTRNRLRSWVIFSLASLGAAYTHYYALISVAFFYLILIVPSLRDRKYLRRTAVTWVAAVAGYLPWLGVLLKSFVSTSGDWWLDEIPTAGECLSFFFSARWLTCLFVLIVAVYLLVKLRRRWCERKDSAGTPMDPELLWVLAGLLSLVGTIAVGMGLSYAVRPFFVDRYLYPLTPVLYLILGFCLSRLDKTKLLCLVLTAGIVVGFWPSYLQIRDDYKYQDMCTAEFLEKITPGENAVFCSEKTADFRYYFPDIPEFSRSSPDKMDPSYDEIWYFRESKDEPEDLPGYSKEMVSKGLFTGWFYYYVWLYQAVE
ncbi:MAG: glycosyltransferase family 39 protein [Eubacteriales bacterium]|nr:glycosyltransferase family 39 protein [Eubacteriales bacterium]